MDLLAQACRRRQKYGQQARWMLRGVVRPPSEDSHCKNVATSLFPLASDAFSPLRKMWSFVMNIT
jgi:hypothetical protein